MAQYIPPDSGQNNGNQPSDHQPGQQGNVPPLGNGPQPHNWAFRPWAANAGNNRGANSGPTPPQPPITQQSTPQEIYNRIRSGRDIRVLIGECCDAFKLTHATVEMSRLVNETVVQGPFGAQPQVSVNFEALIGFRIGQNFEAVQDVAYERYNAAKRAAKINPLLKPILWKEELVARRVVKIALDGARYAMQEQGVEEDIRALASISGHAAKGIEDRVMAIHGAKIPLGKHSHLYVNNLIHNSLVKEAMEPTPDFTAGLNRFAAPIIRALQGNPSAQDVADLARESVLLGLSDRGLTQDRKITIEEMDGVLTKADHNTQYRLVKSFITGAMVATACLAVAITALSRIDISHPLQSAPGLADQSIDLAENGAFAQGYFRILLPMLSVIPMVAAQWQRRTLRKKFGEAPGELGDNLELFPGEWWASRALKWPMNAVGELIPVIKSLGAVIRDRISPFK